MDITLQIGLLLMAGLAGEYIGQRTRLPRVSVLIMLGLALGPIGLEVIPAPESHWFATVAQLALCMIGFVLGGRLSLDWKRMGGRALLSYSLAITLVTGAVVGLGLWALGAPWPVALVLACVSLATDPLATVEVLRGMAPSRLTRMINGVVALDDVWGLLLFGLAISLAGGQLANGMNPLLHGLQELALSVGLGLVLGLAGGWLSGRMKAGEPSLLEALAMVFLCAGLSTLWELNYLLAAIVMGLSVRLSGAHHDRPFHEIEHIEWPFLAVFLLLTGASFELHGFNGTLLLVLAYAVLRTAGRWLGGMVPVTGDALDARERRLAGLCLLPQAGVGLGVALYGAQAFPAHAATIIHTTVLGTIAFELVGPIVAARSLRRMARNPG